MNEKKFIWLTILYNCKYRKEGGVLSDFERVLGYNYQNKTVRTFLKELIENNCLIFKDHRLVNNNTFETYVINKKKIFELIQEQKEYFRNIMKMINEEYAIIGDWSTFW